MLLRMKDQQRIEVVQALKAEAVGLDSSAHGEVLICPSLVPARGGIVPGTSEASDGNLLSSAW